MRWNLHGKDGENCATEAAAISGFLTRSFAITVEATQMGVCSLVPPHKKGTCANCGGCVRCPRPDVGDFDPGECQASHAPLKRGRPTARDIAVVEPRRTSSRQHIRLRRVDYNEAVVSDETEPVVVSRLLDRLRDAIRKAVLRDIPLQTEVGRVSAFTRSGLQSSIRTRNVAKR